MNGLNSADVKTTLVSVNTSTELIAVRNVGLGPKCRVRKQAR